MAGCAGEAASIGLAPGAGGQAGDFATDIGKAFSMTVPDTVSAFFVGASFIGCIQSISERRAGWSVFFTLATILNLVGAMA